MRKITFLLSAAFAATIVSHAQAPRIQVIHNSADVDLKFIDVYDPLGNKIFDDAEFRYATPFVGEGIPVGIPITLSVAPGDSETIDDSFYSFPMTFETGKTYIAVASGTRTDNGYTPFKPFAVSVNSNGRETASQPGNTDILLFQGSTDLPAVDASETGVGLIAANINYGQFLGYLERPTQNYDITITNTATSEVIGNYYAEFEALGLQGKAVTIVGSGFLDNSVNNNGEEFGLWMARPEQGGQLIDMSQQTASLNKNKLTGISVYPNPAKSQITINIPSGSTTLNSVIYDMAGRQVAAGNTATLDISGLSNGIYVIKGSIDGKSFEQKIIKN